MVDVSGIPNMGFGGGGYFGGNAATGQPAMSAAQINAGMWGNYSPGQAQATFNQITGPLTQDPARYAALGASYGRLVAPSSAAAVAASNAARGIGGSVFNTGAAPFQSYGLPSGGGKLPAPSAAGGFNAPRQYGWDANEGAPVLPQPAPFFKGQFNPHTYGWDHNEGADVPAPQAQPDFNSIWHRALPLYMPPMPPSSVTVPQQQGSLVGGNRDVLARLLSGQAMATGTPAGTRGLVPNVGSYMPSGQFGGENTNMFGMNLPKFNLGASGIRGGSGESPLGGSPFGGFVPQDYRGIMGVPHATDIAGSPLAGYGATPSADIANRFGGMQQPVWSPGGITLGDRLRGISPNTLSPQDQGVQGVRPGFGPGIFQNNPFGD